MSLNLGRLLNNYYIRSSFIDKVISNTLNLTKIKKATLAQGLDKDGAGLLENHNYIPGAGEDLIYLKMYDHQDYLRWSDYIEVFPKTFLENTKKPNSLESKVYMLDNIHYGNTGLVMLGVEKLEYKFEPSKESIENLESLKEGVSDEQIRHMMYCVFLRCVDFVPSAIHHFHFNKWKDLSPPQYCEKIYELADPKNKRTYFQHQNPFYSNYQYYVLFHVREFLKTNDAYNLIKAANYNAKFSTFPLRNNLTNLIYKYKYLYF